MRAVIQRVKRASVTVNDEVVSSIGRGLVVLVGVKDGDTRDDLEWLSNKILKARLFPGGASEEGGGGADGGKPWDANVMQAGLEVLFVSQFTLYGFFKGNKPDFHNAMAPGPAKAFYEDFLAHARNDVYKGYGESRIKDGVFGAMMEVGLVNDGPVTMCLDSNDRKPGG